MGFPGLVLLVLGLPFALRYGGRLAWAAALGVGAYLLPVAMYRTNEPDYFALPAAALLWLLIAEGWGALLRLVERPPGVRRRWLPVGLAGALLLAPVSSGFGRVAELAVRRHDLPARSGRALLDGLASGSLVITERSDLAFLLWYLQQVERRGEGVAVCFRHLGSFGWAHRWRGERAPWLRLPVVAPELFEDSGEFNTTYLWGLVLLNAERIPVYLTELRSWTDLAPYRGADWSLVPRPWSMRVVRGAAGSCACPLGWARPPTGRIDRLTADVISRQVWEVAQACGQAGDPAGSRRLLELALRWKELGLP
jgi:hypothetical protein